MAGDFVSPAVHKQLWNFLYQEEFRGTQGLRGGMCPAALSRHFKRCTIEESASAPPFGEPLFHELCNLQVGSSGLKSDGQSLWKRVVGWQMRPRTGKGVRGKVQDSVGELTRTESWPALRKALDTHIPKTLVLMKVSGIHSPGGNHQVVAYAYDTSAPPDVCIAVYDPNRRNTMSHIRWNSDPKDWDIEAKMVGGGKESRINAFFVVDRNDEAVIEADAIPFRRSPAVYLAD